VIVGLGIDAVDVARFARVIQRSPGVLGRLFTANERVAGRPDAGYAVRFAAKEAVAKALGAPGGLRWHDVAVLSEPSGRPRLAIAGTVAAAADAAGVRGWHLSLSHDMGFAVAVVIAEG
jgi:holo-[acyl-carrier protein] synthase